MSQADDAPAFDPEELDKLAFQIRSKQNLMVGLVLGLVAALVSAVVWAGIAYFANYEIGWLAIGVGFLVGIAVLAGGKGVSAKYGVLGGALALFGILAGKYFTVIAVVAREFNESILTVMAELGPAEISEAFQLMFSPIDLVFYALAIFAGFKYSWRPLELAVAEAVANDPKYHRPRRQRASQAKAEPDASERAHAAETADDARPAVEEPEVARLPDA